MKNLLFKRILFIFIILFLLSISMGCIDFDSESANKSQIEINYSIITVTDPYGNKVNITHTPQRIICQNAQTAELLVDIGAGDMIVGLVDEAMTDQYQYLLKQTPNAISIGTCMRPNIETIISLKPDLLIFYGYKKPTNVDKILSTNVTLIYTDSYRLQKLPEEARMLGKITGKEKEAELYSNFTEYYISLVKKRMDNINEYEQKRVYFEAWTNYTTFASDSDLQQVITILSAKNIAENISVSGTVSPEWLIEQNPDVIFKIVLTGENVTDVREKFINRLGSSKLKAVQEKQVYVMYTDTTSSPRAVIGMLYIAKALFPKRFADIDPEKVLQEYATKFLPGSDPPDSFYPLNP